MSMIFRWLTAWILTIPIFAATLTTSPQCLYLDFFGSHVPTTAEAQISSILDNRPKILSFDAVLNPTASRRDRGAFNDGIYRVSFAKQDGQIQSGVFKIAKNVSFFWHLNYEYFSFPGNLATIRGALATPASPLLDPKGFRFARYVDIHLTLAKANVAPELLGIFPIEDVRDMLANRTDLRQLAENHQFDTQKELKSVGILMAELAGGWPFPKSATVPQFLTTWQTEMAYAVLQRFAEIKQILQIKNVAPDDTQFMIMANGDVKLIDLDLYKYKVDHEISFREIGAGFVNTWKQHNTKPLDSRKIETLLKDL